MKVSCTSCLNRLFVGALVTVAVSSIASRADAQTFVNDVPAFVQDDGGADDYPGQKDLNYLEITQADDASAVRVRWGWDDTFWSGNNTGDACVLFDNDTQADGLANLAFCITVEKAGQFKSFRLYTCNNTRNDRCAGPTLVPNSGSSAYLSTGSASLPTNNDPFRLVAAHITGNTCSKPQGCYANDTQGEAIIRFVDFSGLETRMINVCTYPSQEPNSAPSDCVITPGNGFLTIEKTANGDQAAVFTFNLGSGQTFQGGGSSKTITGTGSVELISMAPIANVYDLFEAVPTGWDLTAAGCMITGNGSTGTTDTLPAAAGTSAGVQNFDIKSGIETVCSFTNDEAATTPSISTTQSAVVTLHDTASITGLKADGGAASVEFRVYNTLANCQLWGDTGKLYFEGPIGIDPSYTSATPATITGYSVPTPYGQTVYWGVKYSGNSKNNPTDPECSERTVVGILFQYAPFAP